MPRTKVLFTALAALGLALLAPALSRTAGAGSYSYGFDQNRDDALHWAIVDEDRNSSSNLSELEDLDDLKAEYGRTFLYIRDGDERYVIKERGMMQRVREALKPITEAGREIGKAVGAKVSYSMRRSGYARERAHVERRLARVERRLSRLDDDGEDQEERQELENERQELRSQLDQMKDDRRERHVSEERQAELDAATERASRHMREATRNLDRQLRAILKEAKSRNIANRIED